MFTRTFIHRPQPSLPSAAPRFAVQRFIQPRLTAGPVGDPVERERSEAEEGLEEQEAEALGLERVMHAFVPTLPPRAPGESAPSPPVPRNGSLGSRILRQELTWQPVPKPREPTGEALHSAAAEGVRTPAVTLPFLDRLQASFGRHSIGHVKAHVGPEAARASQAMNAWAFASGDHVVFGGTPDLRTAAHESAHVVQQQAGVQLAGGIGREGDAYERHANTVADAVVAGLSSEELLEPFAELKGSALTQVKHQNSIQQMKFDKSPRFQNTFTTKTGLTGHMLSGKSSKKPALAKERQEKTTEEVVRDDRYPGLIFTLDASKTEEWGENVYFVTGKGLKNSTHVTREVGEYNDIDNEGATWKPLMEGDEHAVDWYLFKQLDEIAKAYNGERCHECATDMQDKFTGRSMVYEIEAESGNHIKVMGSRVRNHYVNVFNEKVYDSSTGGKGVPLEEYMKKLEDGNKEEILKMKKAIPSVSPEKLLDKDSKLFGKK